MSCRKKQFRCIANAGMLEHTLPLFQKLHMLPLEYMYDFCVGQFMYRQVKCVASVSILPQITKNQNIHHYETRVSANVHVQYRRTQKVATSFVNRAPHYWNSLPYELRNVGSITTFNKSHKRYILCHAMA